MGADNQGYDAIAEKMLEIACQQPGHLGIESARDQPGITVSSWRDLDTSQWWKKYAERLIAQQRGRRRWYTQYTTRICKPERQYLCEGDDF